ncbi:MAG: acetyl-CoA carboxylase biotin carboxylase subunit [Dehalococcoidia bacterium]|nr:acetyl-CoA carboxylase biotin carboxylase subunit [Dehalococcoidia bacterium]
MIKRVLIANRGEIALRIQRTCRELGIETVAVYSDPDRNALHVRNADYAVRIGPGPALESYLVIEKIIEAARQTGADAVHPGYGFLSENARFVDACAAAGLTFIGPSAGAMRALGGKVSARRLMAAAGVPIVPGANDISADDFATAEREAARIGFPLMVKASAGGGGRGIRLVERPGDLANAMRAAGNEAAAAFGDATIFLEKYISPARHIEVQIIGDAHGNVRAFGERECSIQRRNQKLVEEAPSVAVTPEIRARLCAAAVAAARSCGYQNAGTVEFLLDRDGNFYFLEVNARLQVEHPVTELVYGIDLVALQILVANGEPLPDAGAAMVPGGWAIECRINGEDPYANFAPSVGLIDFVDFPAGPGVRFDTMLYSGLDVPVFYDSLLAKLIVWAETRERAIERMRRALRDLVISGVQTNAPFHLALLEHPDFRSGDVSTGWLESTFTMPPLPEGASPAEDGSLATALIAGAIAAGMLAGGAQEPASARGITHWVQAARGISRRGLRVDGGTTGWRRGTASR